MDLKQWATRGDRLSCRWKAWNPPFCGEIDIRIARDGAWYYRGTRIRRPELVRHFSTILRKDAQGYVLVTPAEKVGITVEDAPLAIAEQGPSQRLRFRTNVDDGLRLRPAIRCGLKPLPSADKNPISMCAANCGRLWSGP